MASLLVIGGSGFFGKSILDSYRRGLLAPWDISSITVIARHASSLRLVIPELLGADIQLIDDDIGSCDSLPPANYVIHAAASTDAALYLSKPAQERANLLAATTNYCRLAKQFHRDSRIVYASSGAVYGQQNPKVYELAENDDSGPIEQMDLTKQDYAAAKRDGERSIQDLGRAGCEVSIARCFAFTGPYLPRDQHFAIGNFIRDGLLGRVIEVKARHAVYRSYMHSDDLVRWLMTIASNATPNSPIWNVGSNEAILMGDLAGKIAGYFGVDALVPPFSDEKVDRYIPSIKKAYDELGLKLDINLDQAIDKTILAIQKMPVGLL